MKLTRRQHMVLSNFLDLYQENGDALHYTEVAEHLGVNPVTAYDMLRLLEDRNFLASEYVLPSEREGGGRARVVFRPTATAQKLLAELAGDEWKEEEWNLVKERILHALRAGRGSDHQDLLDDLLVRVAEQRSPVIYTAEMVTAVILQAYQLKDNVADSTFLDRMHNMGLSDELSLSAFGGMAVGLSFAERANRRVAKALLAQSERYQEMIGQLNTQSRRHLTAFADQVVELVEA